MTASTQQRSFLVAISDLGNRIVSRGLLASTALSRLVEMVLNRSDGNCASWLLLFWMLCFPLLVSHYGHTQDPYIATPCVFLLNHHTTMHAKHKCTNPTACTYTGYISVYRNPTAQIPQMYKQHKPTATRLEHLHIFTFSVLLRWVICPKRSYNNPL